MATVSPAVAVVGAVIAVTTRSGRRGVIDAESAQLLVSLDSTISPRESAQTCSVSAPPVICGVAIWRTSSTDAPAAMSSERRRSARTTCCVSPRATILKKLLAVRAASPEFVKRSVTLNGWPNEISEGAETNAAPRSGSAGRESAIGALAARLLPSSLSSIEALPSVFTRSR